MKRLASSPEQQLNFTLGWPGRACCKDRLNCEHVDAESNREGFSTDILCYWPMAGLIPNEPDEQNRESDATAAIHGIMRSVKAYAAGYPEKFSDFLRFAQANISGAV